MRRVLQVQLRANSAFLRFKEENVMNGKVLGNAKGGKTVPERKPAGRGQAARRALMTTGAIVGAVLLIGTMVAPLHAQSYPNKPVRLIIPMAAGGSSDIVGRIVAPKLAERLGQPVVPDNRPGAAGIISYEFVAKAQPDGYTIGLPAGPLTISPSLYKKINYDPIKDFAPISMVAQLSFVLIVHPSLPVNSLKELVGYARTNPGKLNYGSSGVGSYSQLTMEMFKSLAKINIVDVAYKGAGQVLIGLLSREVDVLVINPGLAIPQIQAGKVRALAVLSKERLTSLPNVPTAKEAGIDLAVTAWHGMLAPSGTPRDIVNRLNAEWIRSVAMPDVKEQFENAGFEPLSSTPEQFAELIKTETIGWAKVIKEANITRID
jgi:tripartite-type tricarboxylate transporter receptor subunit TctC